MKRKAAFGPGDFDTGLAPEKILGGKKIHTMYINLPNLTSASGSWVLNFAELQERRSASATNNISAPLAVRKVDPKYPTSLVNARVEGEVVLYAIIRADGSVDSIQVLKSLDPELDRNAIEASGALEIFCRYARWFAAGRRSGGAHSLPHSAGFLNPKSRWTKLRSRARCRARYCKCRARRARIPRAKLRKFSRFLTSRKAPWFSLRRAMKYK